MPWTESCCPLWLCSSMTECRPENKAYLDIFSSISQFLPDMNILLNLEDLPIVYVSYEERQRLIAAGWAGVCE